MFPAGDLLKHPHATWVGKKAGPAVADDHVNRHSFADAINVKWLVDITEHRTMEGTVYRCAIEGRTSNRIVGYAIDSRMTSELAVTALPMAIILRGRPAGTVIHSDRGGRFRSKKISMLPRNNGLIRSMGCVASTGANAAMASFFALLQKNVLNRKH